jgi:hypothetical protein
MDLGRYQALKMDVKRIKGGDCLLIETDGFSTRKPVGWPSPGYVMRLADK